MRKLIVGAVSAFALLAPVSAHAQGNGYVDASIGSLDLDGFDLDIINLGGSVDTDLGSGPWRAQFDVDVNRYSDSGDSITTTNAAAHVYYDAGDYAIGGVLTNTDVLFATGWSLGLEGQVNLGGQFVVEGEASFGTLEAFGDSTGTTTISVDGTFYLTDNFSLGAGYYMFDIDEFDDSFNTWRLEGEYQFTGSGASVFANYAQTDVDGANLDAWRIGLRYNFGGQSLRERRSDGPQFLRNSISNFVLT